MCTIAALTTVPCTSNPAGVKGTGYMAPAEEFASWPSYLGTSGAGDSVKLSGNFAFVTTTGIGYFRAFPCLPEKGSYSITSVGGVGSKSFEERYVFAVAGVDAAQLEFVKNLHNIPGVYLCPDKNDVIHVLGTKDDPAYVEVIEGGTGTAATDERILTITVRFLTKIPTIYTGTIDTVAN